MDRAAKGELADRLHALDAAVIVATHDPEFAVAVAERVVLLADGRVIADGPAREVLAGGWYFATETARVLGGLGGALTPEEGAELLRGRHGDRGGAVTWAAQRLRAPGRLAGRGLRLVRAREADRADGRDGRDACGPGRASAGSRSRRSRTSSPRPTSSCSPATCWAARPGSPIGATGALASNVVFGQGPWTPWQMAAWGLCGLLGAALGAATGRRVARVPLALFCGALGLLFGAIMDLSTFTTFAGGHTLAQYLAISGTSLPFNIAHAVGNIVFCLAFGPALVRALERFRARLHVTWIPLEADMKRALALLIAIAALAALPAAASNRSSARAGARWLAAHVRAGRRRLAADTLVALRAAGSAVGRQARRARRRAARAARRPTSRGAGPGREADPRARGRAHSGSPRCAGGLDLRRRDGPRLHARALRAQRVRPGLVAAGAARAARRACPPDVDRASCAPRAAAAAGTSC